MRPTNWPGIALLMALLGLLSACGGTTSPSGGAAGQPTSAPTALPATNTPVAQPATNTPSPAATSAPTTPPATSAPAPATAVPSEDGFAALPQGVTAEGYQMLGQADAPVTLQFFSDFL
jgi:hypothetical protein